MVNRYCLAAVALFGLGIGLLLASVLRGEGSAGIALFVPFFYGTGLLASLGVLSIFGGMVLLLLGFLQGAMASEEEDLLAPSEDHEEGRAPKSRGNEDGGRPAGRNPGSPVPAVGEWVKGGKKPVRGGAVVLIGPIPVVYGSDPGMARTLVILALVLMATSLAIIVALALL